MSAEEICDAMIEQFTTMTFNGITGDNMTWGTDGAVTKGPKGMVISNGAYVGMD
jgi:branched-chain amino acid transport system substrate-binding protein